MKKMLLSLCSVLFLAGCITTAGQIKTSTSSFDGMEEVSMEPGWVISEKMGDANFKLGLHWASVTPHEVVFKAVRACKIVNIESDEGLQFNIDGEIIRLSSPQASTDFNTYGCGESSKRFIGSLDLVHRMIEADSVGVKFVTYDGYLEGNLKAGSLMSSISVIASMPEFLAAVEQRKKK